MLISKKDKKAFSHQCDHKKKKLQIRDNEKMINIDFSFINQSDLTDLILMQIFFSLPFLISQVLIHVYQPYQ